MMRFSIAIAGLVALTACGSVDLSGTRETIENLDLLTDTRRAFSDAYQDQPFEEGTVYVVAEEHGELHTYSLRPCRGGTHICGGGGHVGHLQKTPDYDIVTGAYPGRVFYLSPGGDGYLKWRGEWRDLAWN